eukprot:scaffold1301_cov191-Pinguiococcus_pyrenoidosus.AAC.6
METRSVSKSGCRQLGRAEGEMASETASSIDALRSEMRDRGASDGEFDRGVAIANGVVVGLVGRTRT